MECGPLIKAIDAYIAKADNDLADTLGEEGYAEPEKTLYYAQELEDSVAEALLDETDFILSEAEKSIDLESFADDVWPEVKLNDELKSKLVTVFEETLSEFMPEFVGYYIAQTDRSLHLEQLSKRTTAWVETWSRDLADIMQLNSHKEIETILTKGLKEGSGIGKFIRDIQDSGIRDEYYKARRVAVTEVLTAHRAAHQEAAMQSPAVKEKEWKHTGSYRNKPRQNHVNMSGQRVPKNQPYELHGIKGGTYYPMYPGDTILPPEERINCHCFSQDIVDEDILGMPLEERKRLQQEAVDNMDDDWEKELDEKNKAKAGIVEKYDPNQPRDKLGRWTKIAGGEKFSADSFSGDAAFEVTCNVMDMFLTDTVKERVQEITERVKTASDLKAYLAEKGIEMETSCEALQDRMDEEIPAVKQQADYIIASVEQYTEIGGLSALNTVHFYEVDLDVQAQYSYRATGEDDVEDEGHIYISNRANGFQVAHEFAHAYADSTKPKGLDVVEWSAELNKKCGLSNDATAYFGADPSVIEAEKFADAIGGALAYGNTGNTNRLDFLANVANTILGK